MRMSEKDTELIAAFDEVVRRAPLGACYPREALKNGDEPTYRTRNGLSAQCLTGKALERVGRFKDLPSRSEAQPNAGELLRSLGYSERLAYAAQEAQAWEDIHKPWNVVLGRFHKFLKMDA